MQNFRVLEERMRYKGFIFDLDGVVTDTSEYHFKAWQALGQSIGISFDQTFNESLKGVGRMDSLERILKFGEKSDFFSFEEKSILADQKNSLYVEMIQDMSPIDLFEGVEDLLLKLSQKKIKLAIGSASKNAPFVLNCLGIENYFDYVVDAGKVQNSKPFPDIFLDAARNIELTPGECVAIEDSEAGIEAILAANMYAIGIGDPAVLHRAHIIYPATKDIKIDQL
jgi:beta-phosphoglucomutase